MPTNSRLALGTAQFGLAYGIANRTGKVHAAAISEILAVARANNIDTLDTAIAYGDSEANLGAAGVGDFSVVTKLPPLPDDISDVAAWVNSHIDASLGRIGVEKLHGVLLHRPLQVLDRRGAALYRALVALRESGKAQRVGYSVYGPSDLDALWGDHPVDLIQAPLNLIDQRLIDSGWAARLAGEGVELHTRSAFLQGLLLSPQARQKPHFQRWSSLWSQWEEWLADTNNSPLSACLHFALSSPQVDRAVVGIDSARQLTEILAAAGRAINGLPDFMHCSDPDLIDPSKWPQ